MFPRPVPGAFFVARKKPGVNRAKGAVVCLDRKSTELGFQVLFNAFLSPFTSQTTILHSTKGCRSAGWINVIDADNAEVQRLKSTHRCGQIVAVDVGSEAIVCIVGHSNDVIF